jgi:ABC-type antimicrobial peptide transport system permease subunit
VLRHVHGLNSNKEDDFRVQTPEQLISTVNSVTLVMGGIVGIAPAAKAANPDPIEALRYE